jgi:hypothetical protein
MFNNEFFSYIVFNYKFTFIDIIVLQLRLTEDTYFTSHVRMRRMSDIKHNQSDKQVLWRKADKHLHFRQAQLSTNK